MRIKTLTAFNNALLATLVVLDVLILVKPSSAQVPLYSGLDPNGEQIIDSTAVVTNAIDDLTDHTYNSPVPFGAFSDCLVRRTFACPIASIKVTLISLTNNIAVDSADDIGYVGSILVTPDSVNTGCSNEGSVVTNYDVSSEITINGSEATLLLRAKENCCCETGWGPETTRADRLPARFRWEVTLGEDCTNPCEDDADGDSISDCLDTCPNTPNGCEVDPNGCPVDSDDDDVCDGLDQCLNTPSGAAVDIHGCPIEEPNIDTACPCAGPTTGGAWKNHGEFVRCVAKAATALVRSGHVTAQEKGKMVSQRARSTCGKARANPHHGSSKIR